MIGSVVLFALNILGTLWLESTLTRYYKLEFAIIGLLLVFAMVLASAELKKLPWVWSASTVYFSLSVLNTAMLFLVTSHFLAFSITTVVGLIGMLRSVSRLDEPNFELQDPIPVELETYGKLYKPIKKEEPLYVNPVMWVHPDDLVSDISKVTKTTRKKSRRKRKRKSTKRKTTRKKSARKTTKRKTSTRKRARKKTRRKSSRKKSKRRR